MARGACLDWHSDISLAAAFVTGIVGHAVWRAAIYSTLIPSA